MSHGPSPSRVAHRVLFAARPIRLNRTSVEDLARRIGDQLRQLGLDRRPEPVGDNAVLYEDAFTGVTVDGQTKTVLVVVSSDVRGGNTPFVSGGGFGKVTSGPYKGAPIIVIQLDGRNTWASVGTYARIGKYLVSVLMHEITHAMDRVQTNKPSAGGVIPTSEEVDLVAYYNNPREVRAYMRQMYEELRPYVRPAMERGDNRGIGFIVTKFLGLSSAWKQMSPHLNRENRNRILKGVVTAFEDEMAGGG